jgi:hypothetical protein
MTRGKKQDEKAGQSNHQCKEQIINQRVKECRVQESVPDVMYRVPGLNIRFETNDTMLYTSTAPARDAAHAAKKGDMDHVSRRDRQIYMTSTDESNYITPGAKATGWQTLIFFSTHSLQLRVGLFLFRFFLPSPESSRSESNKAPSSGEVEFSSGRPTMVPVG